MNTKIALHINEIIKETPDAISICFAQPEQAFSYRSGQFLTLACTIDGKEERRCYSLSSSPYVNNHLSVTIKRVKGGKVSNYLIDNLKIGDKIEVLPPAGNFYCEPKDFSRQIVLIGGGSGITPLFSIIKSVLTQEPSSIVLLIYVNVNREQTIFYEALQSWADQFPSRFRILYHWSDEKKNNSSNSGFFSKLFKKKNAHRINPNRLKRIFDELEIKKEFPHEFYLCGPQGLMKMANTTLQKAGFSKQVIYKESFCATNETENPSAKSTQDYPIKILLKGKEHQLKAVAGQPILFSGLESGLELPYSCQSGNCTSCTAKCISGTVAMSTKEGLTRVQIENGYVLTCVGYAHSDDVVVEYD